ncbi:MAG TPA: MFS transporter [Dehalococcoidia bacterium]|nr:MFS transporter [Dehalococcoidia bacterium]
MPQALPKNAWLVLFCISLAQLMSVMNVTFIFTALPQIAIDLHTSLAGVQWIVIANTLTLAATVPLWGRLSDIYERKDLFLLGIAMFVVGAAIASQANGTTLLIAARALQGLGGASMMANALAIVTDVFPLYHRGMAYGLLSVMVSSGGALGPAVGGTIITHFGWDAAFLFITAMGLIILALAWAFVPRGHGVRRREPVDWLGAVILGGALATMLLAVTRGQTWGWDSNRIVGLFTAGGCLLLVFLLLENRSRFPLIRLGQFRNISLATAQLAALFSLGAISVHDFIVPFFWQAARGYSAQEAGLLMLPFPVGSLVGAPLSGRLLRHGNARALSLLGLGFVLAGLLAASQITVDTAMANVFWRFWLVGFGFGFFISPNNSLVMSLVPAWGRGSASGVLGMFRMIGAATGTAVSGTVLGAVISGQYLGLSGSLVTKQDFLAVRGDPARLFQLNRAFEDGFEAAFLVSIGFTLTAMLLTVFSTGRLAEAAEQPEEARKQEAGSLSELP